VYLLQIILGLVDSADEKGSGLHILFVLFLWQTLADEHPVVVREHDASNAVELLHHFPQELCTFTSHGINIDLQIILNIVIEHHYLRMHM
jgi:hypothetical protein